MKILLTSIFHIYLFIKGFINSFFYKKQSMRESIDFVILWVDGKDQEWQKTKDKYEKIYNRYKEGNGEERYRDWEQLRYWFRGVEKYAPWVRNIYLVTCGQCPEWLNVNHPKLKLVNHEDFIDPKYLPTFNSSAIEMNLYKIKDLGEYFVYFNDDMLLTKEVKPEDFFQEGMPLICAAGFPVRNNYLNNTWNHNQFTITGLASKYNWDEIIKKNPEKWFNYKYKTFLRFNWRMCQDSFMSGFYYVHLASPFRKSSLEETSMEYKKYFEQTTQNKFRDPNDITQQLFKIHDIANGDFVPCSPFHFGYYYYFVSVFYKDIAKDIRNQKYKMVCINDSWDVNKENFDTIKHEINAAFDSILPQKSSFEL